MDPRIFEIVSTKPELIAEFPPWMLSHEREHELKDTERLAIVEVAGKDSIAAALEVAGRGDIEALLPTLAYTGTEFGSWEISLQRGLQLKDALVERGIKVFDPLLLGAPRVWWLLCGRYATEYFRALGFYSPCVGCHLYLHAIRIPLAKKIGCGIVVGGERESHEGKIKINQLGVTLDAYVSFAKKFGIELLFPLRGVVSDAHIESLVGQYWAEGTEQLECVLSGNYLDREGGVIYSEDAIRTFLDEFAMQEAERVVRRFLSAME